MARPPRVHGGQFAEPHCHVQTGPRRLLGVVAPRRLDAAVTQEGFQRNDRMDPQDILDSRWGVILVCERREISAAELHVEEIRGGLLPGAKDARVPGYYCTRVPDPGMFFWRCLIMPQAPLSEIARSAIRELMSELFILHFVGVDQFAHS